MPSGACWLRDAPERSEPGRPAPGLEKLEAAQTKRQPVVLCASCRALVAASRERIEVNGCHSHVFVNPEGVIYRIRCFARAPGVARLGEESSHWTWFPGFLWQVCICRACFEQLGWRFRSADATFYALIAERLLELEAPLDADPSN
jgi:hypothetical protein